MQRSAFFAIIDNRPETVSSAFRYMVRITFELKIVHLDHCDTGRERLIRTRLIRSST